MIVKRSVRQLPTLQKQTPKQAQEKYFVSHVTRHPKYQLILSSLKEGVTATQLAAYFAEQGWLTVSERTFTEAVRTFKNKNMDLIDRTKVEGLDCFVDPNQPGADVIALAQQLLRFQKNRLAIGHNIEHETKILSSNMHKELMAANALLETLGKLTGKIQDTNKSRTVSEEPDVLENLNRVKRDQISRDRLHGAVAQLVKQSPQTQTA
jgi:hypothetical protein